MHRLPALVCLALGLGPATIASAAAPERVQLKAPDGTSLAAQVARVDCGGGIEHVFVADAEGRIPLPAAAAKARCTIAVDTDTARLTLSVEPGGVPKTIAESSTPHGTSTADTKTVDMDTFRKLPVGESSGRDFTMVVESSATASRDAAGITLAGTTAAESVMVVEGASAIAWPQQPAPGTLTAGAVDDVVSTRSYLDFLASLQHPNAKRFRSAPRKVLRVVDGRGRPIAGAKVMVGQRSFRSRRDGRVVLVPAWDGIAHDDDVRVVSGRHQRVVPLQLGRQSEQQVVLRRAPVAAPAAKLDLALVLDTTGSMGDELDYLKAEMDALLARLNKRHQGLEIRWGLVVYRDEGDAYVARVHAFTDDFDAFRASLQRQSADGGGDAPEAVHAAFAAAERLQWRDAATASRVLLHLADAPAHRHKTLAALRAADRLRVQGTAIYPIAASGVDEDAEFTMRSMAMFSGGQYVFLTDDSGVGNSHREASEACFSVEPLLQVMGTILEAEIAGTRPTLPRGNRGSGCQGPQRTGRHPLEYSLMDDDALTDFLGQPRTRHVLP